MTTPAYPRTDLACETRPADLPAVPGVRSRETTEDGIAVSELAITDEEAARLMGKPIGRYVTLSKPKLWRASGDDYDRFRDCLAEHMRSLAVSMTGRSLDADFGVLVAGLGNRDITADAIGPLTAQKLEVTRHLRVHEPKVFTAIGRCALSALSPGVLGQTGIETVELIRGAAENAEPDLVIAVDALAARACERLASTVQLCDQGIEPGSGVGNHRQPICRETIGVPVLALGVPTVVDSSTLVYDALGQAGIGAISDELRSVLENGRGFFVSPKESDIITAQLSTLLAESIELAFTV